MKSGLRLFGHPMHIMLVHFPLALWPMSFVCDIVWFLRSDDVWRQMAYWSLAAGLLMAVPVVVTGLIDYIGVNEVAERTALKHMIAMICAATFFGISLLLRESPLKSATAKPIEPLILSAAGMLPLLFGAWLGGELMLRYKVGQIGQSEKK